MKNKTNKYAAKLNTNQTIEMRELYNQGYAIRYIARKFNCYPNTVWNRVYDLSPPQKLSEKMKKHYLKNSVLTEKDVKKIRILAVKHNTNSAEISRIYGISQTAALGIINGRTFRWIEGETKKGKIGTLIEYNRKPKTDKKFGPKPGTKFKVKPGTLKKYAKKFGVKPCTICRWIKKRTFKVKKNELANF